MTIPQNCTWVGGVSPGDTRIDGETFQWAAVDGEGVVFFSGSEAEANTFAEAHGITVVRAEKTREA